MKLLRMNDFIVIDSNVVQTQLKSYPVDEVCNVDIQSGHWSRTFHTCPKKREKFIKFCSQKLAHFVLFTSSDDADLIKTRFGDWQFGNQWGATITFTRVIALSAAGAHQTAMQLVEHSQARSPQLLLALTTGHKRYVDLSQNRLVFSVADISSPSACRALGVVFDHQIRFRQTNRIDRWCQFKRLRHNQQRNVVDERGRFEILMSDDALHGPILIFEFFVDAPQIPFTGTRNEARSRLISQNVGSS